jgi:4'-phosphopantetheinyl transferase EntD
MRTIDRRDPVADRDRSTLPAGVVFAGGSISDGQQALYPEEDFAIRHAVPKRRAEFRAGRTFARTALLQLGMAPMPILPGNDRAPVWPVGIAASITHDDTYCGVIAAKTADFASVGIDIDSTTPLDADLVRLVCGTAELEQRTALADRLAVDFAKLIFCAKESAYKAYFPLTRSVLDFPDVEIRISPGDGTFCATVRASAPVMPNLGRTLAGRFLTVGSHLITWVTVHTR